jgi:Uma2 family endonuclease
MPRGMMHEPESRMTREEYRAWAEPQPAGRFERIQGIEVLSSSTSGVDRSLKLRDYFRVPSLRHYLILWPDTPRIVRHSRLANADVVTEVVTSGEIVLDLPGLTLAFNDFYAD